MTKMVNAALQQLTSEVHALYYVDDTVLIGPAEAVNNALAQLPDLLRASGLELQPTKTQEVWAPRKDGQAGLQVAWALLAKTLPPRVVRLLRAHPVSNTRELCEELQDTVQDTVRQYLDKPTISRRTKRGIHKRGIHEKAKFPLF